MIFLKNPYLKRFLKDTHKFMFFPNCLFIMQQIDWWKAFFYRKSHSKINASSFSKSIKEVLWPFHYPNWEEFDCSIDQVLWPNHGRLSLNGQQPHRLQYYKSYIIRSILALNKHWARHFISTQCMLKPQYCEGFTNILLTLHVYWFIIESTAEV